MPKSDPAKLTKVSVSLPFGLGSAEWRSDPTERKAAWSLYVELVTRVSVQPLPSEEGSIREALSSLYSLFDSTREILKAAGPDVGAAGLNSVGGIAILTLNKGLRPFLTKWHVALKDWESTKPEGASIIQHEAAWPHADQCRADLATVRLELEKYSEALAVIAGLKAE